jgi:hypothetical protein
MLQGLVLTVAIAAPTLVLEENWHGRPMIDQPGHLWVLPTIVVAAAFALGGAVGARRAGVLWKALLQGLVIGTSAAGLLLVADVVRRAVDSRALSEGVLRLWVEAALLSIVIASLGGAISHLRSVGSR